MPDLYMTPEDHAYIKAAVKKAAFREIGGLGVVVVNDQGQPVVRHMRLLKQEISSSEVDWNEEAHSEYLTWLYTPESEGGAGFEGESYGLYSWHSHGNMSTFYSSTDDDFITKMGLTAPWIYSSIFNNKGESRHRVDLFQGLNELCPALNGHAYWEGDHCKLWVFAHPAAQPILDEMDSTEETYDKLIESLEAEKKEQLEKLDKALTEATKSAGEDAQARMDGDYEEYVSLPPTKTWTGTAGKTTAAGPSSSSNGKGSKGDKESGKKPDAATGNGSDPTGSDKSTSGDSETDFRKLMWFRVYDMTNQCVLHMQLSDVISDMDLILLEEIPEDVMDKLREDEQAMIAMRDNVDELTTKLLLAHHGYGYHGWAG